MTRRLEIEIGTWRSGYESNGRGNSLTAAPSIRNAQARALCTHNGAELTAHGHIGGYCDREML